jgi:hypothetical protein
MPVPVLSAELTPAQKAALDAAFDTIITTIKAVALVNLTPQERQSLQSIDNIRMPYVFRTFSQHVVNFPNLVPAYLSLPEAAKDADLVKYMAEYTLKAKEVLELITDMGLLAEHETYEFFLEFYNSASRAKEKNVPGADTVYNDLQPLFEQEDNSAPLPNP